ncbi:class I SAM-dependent methyltransferase [Kitasatospora sp. NPDC051984]|uniref:class I SAM-dependent methyltransferase n=1 Tax=unclassified Kitasatospora TaxID=2633591 RepID=UPI00371F553D
MFSDAEYSEHVAAAYDDGQHLPPHTMRKWVDLFVRHAGHPGPRTVLDLGCGTGRFTPLLAEAFDALVVGVEPSEPMLTVARAGRSHPRVDYRGGNAESIPLPDASCDLTLIFQVVQHFSDPARAAAETARVTRPGGRVLIHGFFAGRGYRRAHSAYFPSAHGIEESRLPGMAETIGHFTAAGLRPGGTHRWAMDLATSRKAYYERLSHRALSIFQYLSEAEIESGLNTLRAEADSETVPRPVPQPAELLVLHKPHS